MFIATLDTSHYHFMTAGASEVEALDFMREAWNRHAAQTGALATWREMSESAVVAQVEVGTTLRDGEAF